MSTTLTLTEWRTTRGLALTPAQVRLLQQTFRAKVEAESWTPDGTVRWLVTPTSIVGAASADGADVVVRPKTPVGNVLFLLGVAAGRRADTVLDDVVQLAQAPDLTTAVAALFARVTERVLQDGVLRGYRPVSETRHTVRGRVDVAEQLRRRPGRGAPVAVRYDEHDEDVLENRLLLTAARALTRLRPHPDVRRGLHRIVAALDDVTPLRIDGPVPDVAWTRLNVRYRPAVDLARLVLSRSGLDLAPGDTAAVGLTLDMNSVFERFVCSAVADVLSGRGGRPAPQDHTWRLDERGTVRLRPDLVVYDTRGVPSVVLDTKYKVTDGTSVPSSDVYQMLAYCTALELDRGHLVYARADDIPALVVRHGGPAIEVHSLDLSVPPPLIWTQIRALGERIA